MLGLLCEMRGLCRGLDQSRNVVQTTDDWQMIEMDDQDCGRNGSDAPAITEWERAYNMCRSRGGLDVESSLTSGTVKLS